MKKTLTTMVLIVVSSLVSSAKQEQVPQPKEITISQIETLQKRLAEELQAMRQQADRDRQGIESLRADHQVQEKAIDSLQAECARLAQVQNADRDTLNGRLSTTNNAVASNQSVVESRTLWGGIIALVLVVLSLGIAYILWKRIKSETSSIDEVRKAQEALQAAQTKMQEESVKLDNKLIELAEKQLEQSNGKPDHSLIVKLADEIARIETNLSKMNKNVRGYKQLVQAKDRMINNVRAYGYEIVSLLGQEYNEGMPFETRFVPDFDLPEGKRIITGMIKMQVNYNGQMIQPAQIVVSQNI